MKGATAALALVAGLVGLQAARLWFKSTQEGPDLTAAYNTADEYLHLMFQVGAVLDALVKSANLNRQAAKWTAWAAGFGAASALTSIWG